MCGVEGCRCSLFITYLYLEWINYYPVGIKSCHEGLTILQGSSRGLCVTTRSLHFCSGENEYLRRAVRGRPVSKRGLRILSMDGGGMRGMATVQMLRNIEQGTGRRIHEMFDLICGTSTGGLLAVALGIKLMDLDQCEDIYKSLGEWTYGSRLLFSQLIIQ